MKDRWPLVQKGLFPETLPPCFSSHDLRRAMSGMVNSIKAKELHQKRHSDYVPYSGTKHDGSRRYFGSPNPVSYFYVASFIAEHWDIFEERFSSSPFSVSSPRMGKETDDRPVIIPSLSELTTEASKKLGRSAFILKTDITQFFGSVYTHSISWSAHGIEQSKTDTRLASKVNFFNKLDFHVRNCQQAETRGVLIGPDAFRLVSEFIASGIDGEIFEDIKQHVVGGARHVDDYYIGITQEAAALSVLSTIRDKLHRYGLHINDSKTKTLVGTEPLNDLWAQQLRKESRELVSDYRDSESNIILFIGNALRASRDIGSDSPVKIALRTLDQINAYRLNIWTNIEPYLQRIAFHHPHCIDYICLLVAKRYALEESIDKVGWSDTCQELIFRHMSFNHHHEVSWLIWLMAVTKTKISYQIIEEVSKSNNAHLTALLVAAYQSNLIEFKPPIKLGSRLPSTDKNWLLNIVARSSGYSKASFSGALSEEFEHLADRKVKFLDFESYMKSAKGKRSKAISRTRYGYDGDDYHDDEDYLNWA